MKRIEYAKSIWKLLLVCMLSHFLSFLPQSVKAQDTILQTDSIVIEAKVIEITADFISYKKTSNPDGPLYTIARRDVLLITYENGEKEVFVNEPVSAVSITEGRSFKDSLDCIEKVLGLKFENSTEFTGGISIVKIDETSMFSAKASKLLSSVITVVYVKERRRVTNINEFVRAIFDFYNLGYVYMNFVVAGKGPLSKYLNNNSQFIDFSSIKDCFPDASVTRLSKEASYMVGEDLASMNVSPGMMIFGTLSGLAFGWSGVAGTLLLASGIPVKAPKAPEVAESREFAKGYKKQTKKNKILWSSTMSMVGWGIACFLILGVCSN